MAMGDAVQSSLHLSASELSWKSHETKIQLKTIFIDEFEIPFQVEHFEKWPRIVQFANSDKDSDDSNDSDKTMAHFHCS